MESKQTYNLRKDTKLTEKGKVFKDQQKMARKLNAKEDVIGIVEKEGDALGITEKLIDQQDTATEDVSLGGGALHGAVEDEQQPGFEDTRGGVEVDQQIQPSYTFETQTPPHNHTPEENQNIQNQDVTTQLLNFMQLLNRKMDETNQKMDQSNQNLNQKMDETNQKMDQNNQNLNQKMDETNQKMDENNKKTNQNLEESYQRISTDINQKIEESMYIINSRMDNICTQFENVREQTENSIKNIRSEITEHNLEQSNKINGLELKVNQHEKRTEGHLRRIVVEQENMKKDVEKLEKQTHDNESKIDNLREDVNETLKNLHDDKEQNEKMTEIKQQIDEAMRKLEQQQSMSPNIYVTCTGGNNSTSDNNIPTFNGRAYNPQEFLNKLKAYYHRNLNRTNVKIDNEVEYMKDVLENALVNNAARWWQFIKNDINSWNEFEKTFTQKYWSREVQRGIRQQLETERYRTNGRLTRAEYLLRHVLTLRSMSEPPSDEEIINILSEHFDELVQSAIRVQDIHTISQFEMLLQRTDIAEQRKTNKKTYEQQNYQNRQPNRQNQQRYDNRNANRDIPPRYNGRENNINQNAYHNQNHQYPNQNPNWNRNSYPRNNNTPIYQRPEQNPNRMTQTYYRSDQSRRPTYPTREQTAVCQMVTRENQRPPSPRRPRIVSQSQEPPPRPPEIPPPIASNDLNA